MNLLSPLIRPGAGSTVCGEIMQRDRGRSAQPAGPMRTGARGCHCFVNPADDSLR